MLPHARPNPFVARQEQDLDAVNFLLGELWESGKLPSKPMIASEGSVYQVGSGTFAVAVPCEDWGSVYKITFDMTEAFLAHLVTDRRVSSRAASVLPPYEMGPIIIPPFGEGATHPRAVLKIGWMEPGRGGVFGREGSSMRHDFVGDVPEPQETYGRGRGRRLFHGPRPTRRRRSGYVESDLSYGGRIDRWMEPTPRHRKSRDADQALWDLRNSGLGLANTLARNVPAENIPEFMEGIVNRLEDGLNAMFVNEDGLYCFKIGNRELTLGEIQQRGSLKMKLLSLLVIYYVKLHMMQNVFDDVRISSSNKLVLSLVEELKILFDDGILMCDLHSDNIGRRMGRDGRMRPCIMDGGWALPIESKWKGYWNDVGAYFPVLDRQNRYMSPPQNRWAIR